MAPTMMVHAPVMAASPSSFAASRPTLALSPSQPIPPAETGFNGMAESDVVAVGHGSGDAVAAGFGEPTGTRSKSRRTGRKARSKLQVVVWVLISVAVIGGGVFAGFQIRAIRLRHQIAAARDRASDLAKADTWQGWIDARDALFSIAQASSTADNRAAFARARGVLAFEFGDGVADARRIVDGLAGQSGADLPLAAAYVALAQRDGKAAHDAAGRALQEVPGDAAALYVSGQAAELAGDLKAALAALRGAVDRESRPAYLVGLARALGDATAWDEALAALDKAGNNPGAVIARGVVLAGGGRVIGGQGGEIRAQLAKLIADGQKPADKPGDRPADVSPAQVAFADLALARVDFARGEPVAAQADARASLALNLEDPRFAEEVCDTLLAIGDVETARKAVAHTLEHWPTSRRARISLAEVDLAIGKPADALEVFKSADAAAGAAGQTVRGRARLASGDVDGARADFDAVLKKQPEFEPALIARAGLDLAAGDIDAARKRIERKLHPKTPTAGMAAIYAAILRATGEPEARDKAKALLERIVVGSRGPDTPRAQLELARIDRDLGDMGGARASYLEAARAGNPDARLESATLLIDNRDPGGGHDALEQLLKDAGDQAGAALLLEAARARALVGDHNGAFDLLARADKAPGVVRWQLDREHARIALRKGDTAGAAHALVRALDGCGADLDTYLLAADTVAADDRQTELAGRLKAAVPARLKGKPEADIIAGKLAIAANQFDEADKVYTAAYDALRREKAAPRRLAQCDFGIAVTAYFRREDAKASSRLNLALAEDPSIDQAYLFAAELDRTRDPDKALETARLAVAYNPDSVEGWRMVGTIAAQLPKQRKLLDEAISRINDLAPTSDALHQLQRLK
jgi:tetratricopeptide (TPR) repeat protein